MKKPYALPLLPIVFDEKTELAFYKKIVIASSKLEKFRVRHHYSLVNTSFMELLTIFESVQSTRIEGTQVTFMDMLEGELEEKQGWEETEVRNYRKALHQGIEEIRIGYPLRERLIRDMHQTLMENARGSSSAAGEYRKIQNFIGPTNEIKDASYIPPEPQMMADYMTNLERFINGNPYEPLEVELHPLLNYQIGRAHV